MPDCRGDPRTFQQAASGEDAAADAGPQRDTDDVRVALRAADPDFTQRHAVGVVGDSGRQTELRFQLRFIAERVLSKLFD